MKLRFLGQTYSGNNSQIETLPSEHQARFLGQRYAIRRPLPTIQSQIDVGDVKRKYRGVMY